MSKHILIVDNDAPLRDVVHVALTLAGFSVSEAADGASALAAVDRSHVDLVVLDVAMPVMDGLSCCRALRARPDGGPSIIFLTARDDEIDRINGLDLGADDYVTKPFSPRELVSRVRAVLRRAQPEVRDGATPAVRSYAGLRVDLDERRVWVHETPIPLTATEFELLSVLMRRPGKVYTRDEIVEGVYGDGHHISDRTIDSHVRRIRSRLLDAGFDLLRTAHGVGYAVGPA
jgi:two-component system OmpR family response regulator